MFTFSSDCFFIFATMIRKIAKKAGIVFGLFSGIIFLYLLTAWGCSYISISGEDDQQRGEVEIYLLTNGVHTDIVMPVRADLVDWHRIFPFENTISKDSTYRFVAVGWGDKSFYMEIPEWSDLTLGIALRAAFGISTSALHVTYYKQMIENRDCIKVLISGNQYKRLVEYIQDSRQVDECGNSLYIETDAQYGLHDSFYEAKRRYSFFYTCNTWANNALKYSGQKAALWTLHYQGIFNHYRK